MTAAVPAPDFRTLVPPLLACLSTASSSAPPPPALLELLSPLLAQRVQLLSSDAEPWLPLLCRSGDSASRLPGLIQNSPFEPHPVSGEVELDVEDPVLFCRPDAETLKARALVADTKLVIIYSWQTGSDEKGNGWKIDELVLADDKAGAAAGWFPTIETADVASSAPAGTDGAQHGGSGGASDANPSATAVTTDGEKADEDAYWNCYDATPLAQSSTGFARETGTLAMPSDSDDAFYAQYADVRPALDYLHQSPRHENLPALPDEDVKPDVRQDNQPQRHPSENEQLSRLQLSAGGGGDQTEPMLRRGVREHIARSIYSLQQLAVTSDIGADEFEILVKTELTRLRATQR